MNLKAGYKGVLIAAWFVLALPAQTENRARPDAKDSLTGCVDERDGIYVLTNDTNLKVIARLRPVEGSPDDRFARHLGHKVTVRGKLSNEGSPPVMTVKSVDTISEACASAPGTQ
ncbi:MAG: hypothetical protein U0Q18_05160 [Bryobacteraceae bacterium]